MKKTLSVILAALLLLSSFGILALAADGNIDFKPVYTVRAADNSADKIRIVGVYGNNEVTEGETFYFTIDYLKDYRPDETTLVKAYPASYPADLVGTYEDTTEIITLTPDPATGIYKIKDIHEDWCVAVYSLQKTSFSSLKDMLISFFRAIAEFFANIFNSIGS